MIENMYLRHLLRSGLFIVAAYCLSGSILFALPPANALANKKSSRYVDAKDSAEKEELVFSENFDDKNSLQAFRSSQYGELVDIPGRGKVLKVTVGDQEQPGMKVLALSIPVEKLRGYSINFEVSMKTENISKEDKPYFTAKFLLHCQYPNNGHTYVETTRGTGSKDWHIVRSRGTVPFDATKAELRIGLENCKGTVWYDDIKITIHRKPPPPVSRQNTSQIFKGHAVKRLRGVMVTPADMTEGDIKFLAEQWGANLIRWQLSYPWMRDRKAKLAILQNMTQYRAWVDQEIVKLDRALGWCKKYNMMIVVDLHTAPGWRAEREESFIFRNEEYRKVLVETWEKLAHHYKGNPNIWGYDLYNEPCQREIVPEDGSDWATVSQRVAKAIRNIDPDMPIIVESEIGGSLKTNMEKLIPIDVPGVIYSFHMYKPSELTHQGVKGQKMGVKYPGKINGMYWNKAQLRKTLKPVLDFQKRYNTHIYVGEFSCVRWAPNESAFRYLKDSIDLFEEFGWDWSYHTFRHQSWTGWSVEHGADKETKSKATTPTKREQLLRKWFSKNREP